MHLFWRTAAGIMACFFFAKNATAIEPGSSAEISYEYLDLPESSFTHTFDFFVQNAPVSVPSREQNHDGDVDGARLDLSLAGTGIFMGAPVVAGVKGYYAEHDGDQVISCQTLTLAQACNRMPLFDPDPNLQSSVGYGAGVAVYESKLDTRTWGIALEAQTAGSKPIFGVADLKLGAGYRRIDTEFTINGGRVSGGAPVPFTLDEDNGTGYLGGYVGAGSTLPLGAGFVLTIDAEVGVYWAHTEYDGQYTSAGMVGVAQSLSLERDEAAAVAALKLGFEKDFGSFQVAVFGRGEYYSYAPEMRYNEIDRVGGVALGGIRDGTTIGDGDAWTASAGGRVTVPFN
ncbi:hypothetical protein [Hyphomicrobium sp.]|uniref:hypothetical protein n=1 Tax=Hyphomicrobium sp. TaxID=82 RepID=UPI0025BED050|nr:hypothetical protein [Hyphomicrobium sp.]MCC7251991.1 hypothetical protein [Hyphomicrobium sp.]